MHKCNPPPHPSSFLLPHLDMSLLPPSRPHFTSYLSLTTYSPDHSSPLWPLLSLNCHSECLKTLLSPKSLSLTVVVKNCVHLCILSLYHDLRLIEGRDHTFPLAGDSPRRVRHDANSGSELLKPTLTSCEGARGGAESPDARRRWSHWLYQCVIPKMGGPRLRKAR